MGRIWSGDTEEEGTWEDCCREQVRGLESEGVGRRGAKENLGQAGWIVVTGTARETPLMNLRSSSSEVPTTEAKNSRRTQAEDTGREGGALGLKLRRHSKWGEPSVGFPSLGMIEPFLRICGLITQEFNLTKFKNFEKNCAHTGYIPFYHYFSK